MCLCLFLVPSRMAARAVTAAVGQDPGPGPRARSQGRTQGPRSVGRQAMREQFWVPAGDQLPSVLLAFC